MVFWGGDRRPTEKMGDTVETVKAVAEPPHSKGRGGDPSFVRAGTEGRGYAGLEDGTGFGYVGVEFVDCVGVLLLDYAALEFHGEG
jgi:hypothetical protein